MLQFDEAVARGNLGYYFHEPLATGSHLLAIRAFLQKSFFGSPR